MEEIKKIEAGTDLKRVAVISKTGMSIASATSDQMDADAETASSAALIDLAEKLSESVAHGDLREILVKADSGFVILQSINTEYMIFGGISNPFKIGYYMEYLRSKAIRFAFLLAGNTITAELKKEIEVARDRDSSSRAEAKAPLAQNFQIDKSQQADMDAMKGVLAFLKDWSEEDGATEVKPTKDNIVGIDKDLLFGMDNIAPQPISSDQLVQARTQVEELKSTETPAGENPIDEIPLDVLSSIMGNAAPAPQKPATPSTPSVAQKTTAIKSTAPAANVPKDEFADVGLPLDILSTLDQISESTKTTPSAAQKEVTKAAAAQKTQSPYGIKLFEGEVPPIPLEDYVSFEVGSLGVAEQPATAAPTAPNSASQSAPTLVFEQPGSANAPNFDAMASEYDDPDLKIEEDAMLDALNELNLSPDQKKKKNPFTL